VFSLCYLLVSVYGDTEGSFSPILTSLTHSPSKDNIVVAFIDIIVIFCIVSWRLSTSTINFWFHDAVVVRSHASDVQFHLQLCVITSILFCTALVLRSGVDNKILDSSSICFQLAGIQIYFWLCVYIYKAQLKFLIWLSTVGDNGDSSGICCCCWPSFCIALIGAFEVRRRQQVPWHCLCLFPTCRHPNLLLA
jgi:hypothetical protein